MHDTIVSLAERRANSPRGRHYFAPDKTDVRVLVQVFERKLGRPSAHTRHDGTQHLVGA